MNYIIIVITCLLIIAGCFATYFFYNRRRTKGIISGIITLVAVLLVNSFSIIPTGYTGVKVVLGRVNDEVITNAVVTHIPFIESIKLVNNKQTDLLLETTIWSETADQTVVYYANPVITYQIAPEKSAWIIANVSGGADNLISSELVASAIKTASKELATEDSTSRGKIEPLSAEKLQEAIDTKYGEGVIDIISVVIQDADFEDSYNEAIAARQQAEIEAETEAIENQKAIDKAEADKQVTLTNAEAEKEAAIIEAEGQAEANRIVQESWSDEVYQSRFLEAWNGELPQVMDSDSSILVDITEE